MTRRDLRARVTAVLAMRAAAGLTPASDAQLAAAMGVGAAHLAVHLAGFRGEPDVWGSRGGRVSVDAIAVALGLDRDVLERGPVEGLMPGVGR